MKTKIKDIATIRTGVFARPKPPFKREVVYLQTNHFNKNGSLKGYVKSDLPSDILNRNHFLVPGEILFSAKGFKNFATVFSSGWQTAVASSSFLVLSVNLKKVRPEFVAWYLNTAYVQAMLKKKALGTSIQSISKSSLEELSITIPSMKEQENIIKINALTTKANFIRSKISKLEKKMVQRKIFNYLNKKSYEK